MPCPTCSHALAAVGHGTFHCPHCGTLKVHDAVHVPALASRLRPGSGGTPMGETRHTPGPWIVDSNALFPEGSVAEGRGPKTICRMGGGNDDFTDDLNGDTTQADANRANALLIAAAPAYAVAWSLVPDEIKGRIFALCAPAAGWVEAAIRKATDPT